jgi:hypothetical protein
MRDGVGRWGFWHSHFRHRHLTNIRAVNHFDPVQLAPPSRTSLERLCFGGDWGRDA